MPTNNEVTTETVNTVANEVANTTDNTGAMLMVAGFMGGIAIVSGLFVLKTKITKKRSKKAEQPKESEE